jgi:hypothetical protein
MNMVGILGLKLGEDRESGAATDQRDNAASAGWSQDGVAFEVAQAKPALDDFGTVANASRSTRRGILAAARAFATSPQKGFPVVLVPILLDLSVDRAGRYVAARLLRMGAFLSAGDLLGRPVLDQALAHRIVQLRLVQLPLPRSLPPSPLSQLLGLGGEVFTPHTIPRQLAADRPGMASQFFRDLVLKKPSMTQLR